MESNLGKLNLCSFKATFVSTKLLLLLALRVMLSLLGTLLTVVEVLQTQAERSLSTSVQCVLLHPAPSFWLILE